VWSDTQPVCYVQMLGDPELQGDRGPAPRACAKQSSCPWTIGRGAETRADGSSEAVELLSG